eukprot:11214591-Lingulodinium_polyedra.AAC.1
MIQRCCPMPPATLRARRTSRPRFAPPRASFSERAVRAAGPRVGDAGCYECSARVACPVWGRRG